jgi:hypothetical protein
MVAQKGTFGCGAESSLLPQVGAYLGVARIHVQFGAELDLVSTSPCSATFAAAAFRGVIGILRRSRGAIAAPAAIASRANLTTSPQQVLQDQSLEAVGIVIQRLRLGRRSSNNCICPLIAPMRDSNPSAVRKQRSFAVQPGRQRITASQSAPSIPRISSSFSRPTSRTNSSP